MLKSYLLLSKTKKHLYTTTYIRFIAIYVCNTLIRSTCGNYTKLNFLREKY